MADSKNNTRAGTMTHIVAVDGGASRCRMVMFSAQGEMLARVVVDDHASLSMGVHAAWQHIEQGLVSLRSEMGYAADWLPSVLSMGLAGSLRTRERAEFLSLVPDSIHVHLCTDGLAQLYGASAGAPAICLAVGTGSVVHWLAEDGTNSMAGGWGFPAGDQGSGAWLGLRALQHLITCYDQDKLGGELYTSVQQLTGTSISEIQSWTTQARSSAVAQLAPLVFDAATSGDSVAQALLLEAADHCMRLIDCAPESLPVFVVGGVGEQLVPMLKLRLGKRLQESRGDALWGLMHLATQ